VICVDLKSDLGESFGRWTLGDDAAMVRHITSANRPPDSAGRSPVARLVGSRY